MTGASESNQQERRIPVEVQGDHLDRLARCPTHSALAELIWNALDADATRVDVRFVRNALSGIDAIEVEDDGVGIGSQGQDVDTLFSRLGGSWKAKAVRTKHNRALHGKAGEGRFRAFALGDRVVWASRRLENGKVASFTIKGSRRAANFTVSEVSSAQGAQPGTTVTVSALADNLKLDASKIVERLTPEFALYLQQYAHIEVAIDGAQLDPSAVQRRRKDLPALALTLGDESVSVEITVIEWDTAKAARALWLCDEHGFSLLEQPAGIQAPGFVFTAYVKSRYLRELHNQGMLDTELVPGREKVLEGARKSLRDYFRERSAEEAKHAVERWRTEEIYPYEATPASPVEAVERQVFDICALNLAGHLPDFERSDVRQKKLAFRLLKEAIESNPDSLQTILVEVLGLPREKQDELAELLRETTLSSIINASKVVSDRVKFVAGLEHLLFDPNNKKRLLERKQLHRILAQNTWIFGEQYALTVDDESLNTALTRHLELLGRPAVGGAPVLREDGTEGVLDLMLSRVLPLPHHDRREHLVVELKRPSQSVDSKVLQQIKDYAFAVASDERFRDTQTTWRFVAVSNEVSPTVSREASQKNRPRGLVYEDEDSLLTVWVMTWSQVIEEARSRLEFFRRALDVTASTESAQEHLRAIYSKYLPAGIQSESEPAKE